LQHDYAGRGWVYHIFLKQGNHAAVVEIVPEFRVKCTPEEFFAHYSMLIGALGGKELPCQSDALQ
jgi:hypothetical protein